MEVVFTLFRLITSFSLDILYDISLVNNLFNFNLGKKVIVLKEKKLKQRIPTKSISQKVYFAKKKSIVLTTQHPNCNTEEDNNCSAKRINEENKINSINENPFITNLAKRRQSRRKTHVLQLQQDFNNLFSFKRKNMTNKNCKIRYDLNKVNSSQDTKRAEERIIDKVKMTRVCIYCCFCYTRRRKILQNILLDEGMNIISEKLDIFNIFEQLYKNGNNPEKKETKESDIIEMSDSCIYKLKSFNNKLDYESDSANA